MSGDNACTKTGKHRYATSSEVHKAMSAKRNNRHRQQKPYRCKFCNGWHMTHHTHETRPKETARTIKP